MEKTRPRRNGARVIASNFQDLKIMWIMHRRRPANSPIRTRRENQCRSIEDAKAAKKIKRILSTRFRNSASLRRCIIPTAFLFWMLTDGRLFPISYPRVRSGRSTIPDPTQRVFTTNSNCTALIFDERACKLIFTCNRPRNGARVTTFGKNPKVNIRCPSYY
jgi:hypothetical protein